MTEIHTNIVPTSREEAHAIKEECWALNKDCIKLSIMHKHLLESVLSQQDIGLASGTVKHARSWFLNNLSFCILSSHSLRMVQLKT